MFTDHLFTELPTPDTYRRGCGVRENDGVSFRRDVRQDSGRRAQGISQDGGAYR